MEPLISLLKQSLSSYFKASFPDAEPSDFVFQSTNKDHTGDLTLMVFTLAKLVKLNPDTLAGQLGEHLSTTEWVDDFEVIKGFLNLHLSKQAFQIVLSDASDLKVNIENTQKIVLEYCGPNTNKPIHIGHLRNMFLGYSVAGMLKEVGHDVHKVNIFNDRGIAICKSMVGYLEFGNNTTPESVNMKGDFFVGKFYILFSQECALQAKPFIEQGLKKKMQKLRQPFFKKQMIYCFNGRLETQQP